MIKRTRLGIPFESIYNVVHPEEILSLLESNKDYFSIEVKESTMEPKFSKGDLAIVKKQDYIKPGEIGAVYIKGKGIKIRKIIKENNRIMLFSSNENSASPEVYNLNDSKDIQGLILGRVVELRTKF